MGLIDRVAAIFRRDAAEEPARTTSGEMQMPGPAPLDLAAQMRAASDRRSVVKVCREMYREDPRARGVIGTLARDMVRGGCEVVITEAPAGQGARAEEVVAALAERLDLNQRLDDWLRLTLRDGDSFLEVGVDDRMEIAEVTRKPTLEVRRFSDRADRFEDPRRAFWQGEEWTQAPTRDVVWYADWQMIHMRWAHDEGSRYGEPLFASATKAYKRMSEGETDVAVRRKTRAGLKYVHQFPEGTDAGVIESYKEINKDALNNPLSAIADFFGTVDVKVVQGDARLGEIEDVMHHIRTWWLASPAPMSLLGYGQDLNRDVLEQQEEQYRRALEGLTAFSETEIVRPLLERQWLLAGIYPAGLRYEIKWRSKETLTAASVEQAANAALKLRAIGAPTTVVQGMLEMLLPGVDLGEEWDSAQNDRRKETRATAERLALAGELVGR